MLDLRCIRRIDRLVIHRIQLELIVIQKDRRALRMRRRPNPLLRLNCNGTRRRQQCSAGYIRAAFAASRVFTGLSVFQHRAILECR
jgi:hypothetical protein